MDAYITPDSAGTSEQFVIIKQDITDEADDVPYEHLPQRLPEHGLVTDLWRYCRICASAYDTMVPIYDECGIEQQLEEKINSYLPITVSTNDTLPLQLCRPCVERLNTTHDLIVSCLDSRARYEEYLESVEFFKSEVKPERMQECISTSPTENVLHDVEESAEAPKVKKKVVVLKLVHSNATDVPPAVRIAKALEYLKLKNKEDQHNQDSSYEASLVTENSSLTFSNSEKKTLKQTCTESSAKEMDKLQVASIAEFCVITSGKDGSSEMGSESPKLESKISKALGTVDNGTKQRIVEAVQNIVSKKKGAQGKSSNCEECGCDFQSQDEATNHVCPKRNYKQGRNGDTFCKVCNKRFKDIYKLTVHKHIHKKDNVFACSICGQNFRRKDSLQIHRMLHKVSKPHICQQCDKRFLHRTSLERHLSEIHQETKPWFCGTCNRYYGSLTLLHLHHCSPTKTLIVGKCDHCPKSFRNEYILKEHMKTHIGEKAGKAFSCKQCPKVFKSREYLKQHEPIHMGVRPYQCGICSIGFIRKGNLTKHYKTHSAEKIITCKICKATFPSVAGLLNHRKTHSKEEWDEAKKNGTGTDSVKNPVPAPDSYQCSVCNKFLSSKLSLSLHMRVHTGEKPYQCEICNKRFTQKPALTYHKRLHTGERPHACQFCGKGFNSKVGKESHERIHTGERPYKCGQCGVGFRCSANLRQHTWIHTDNRPFICEVCSKLFRRREALQVHMRIHTGERPYSCAICGRSFTQKGDMLKHTRSHTKKNVRVTGMECHYCGQVFSRKMHYKMHVEKCNAVTEQLLVEKQHTSTDQPAFVNFKDQVILKDASEDIKSVTIASEDMVPKFSEITIVTNDIQEYEVEYQS